MLDRRFAWMLAFATAAAPASAFAQSSSAGDAAATTGIGVVFTVFTLLFFVFYGVILLASIAGVVFWVFMIVDVAQRLDTEFTGAMQGRPSPNEKMIWLLVVLLGGVVGSIVYYVVVMRPYPRTPRVGPPAPSQGAGPQPPAPQA